MRTGWDQVSSSLDARESVFELHASRGMPAWRARLRSWFEDYNDLANGVQQFLSVEFPNLDLSGIRDNSNEHSTRTISIYRGLRSADSKNQRILILKPNNSLLPISNYSFVQVLYCVKGFCTGNVTHLYMFHSVPGTPNICHNLFIRLVDIDRHTNLSP